MLGEIIFKSADSQDKESSSVSKKIYQDLYSLIFLTVGYKECYDILYIRSKRWNDISLSKREGRLS